MTLGVRCCISLGSICMRGMGVGWCCEKAVCCASDSEAEHLREA